MSVVTTSPTVTPPTVSSPTFDAELVHNLEVAHSSSISHLRSQRTALEILQSGEVHARTLHDGEDHKYISDPSSDLLAFSTPALALVLKHVSVGAPPPNLRSRSSSAASSASPASSPRSSPLKSLAQASEREKNNRLRKAAVSEVFGESTVVDKNDLHSVSHDRDLAIQAALRYREKMISAKNELNTFKLETAAEAERAVEGRLLGMFEEVFRRVVTAEGFSTKMATFCDVAKGKIKDLKEEQLRSKIVARKAMDDLWKEVESTVSKTASHLTSLTPSLEFTKELANTKVKLERAEARIGELVEREGERFDFKAALRKGLTLAKHSTKGGLGAYAEPKYVKFFLAKTRNEQNDAGGWENWAITWRGGVKQFNLKGVEVDLLSVAKKENHGEGSGGGVGGEVASPAKGGDKTGRRLSGLATVTARRATAGLIGGQQQPEADEGSLVTFINGEKFALTVGFDCTSRAEEFIKDMKDLFAVAPPEGDV